MPCLASASVVGGNLVTLQENYDFPEEWARFYTAELLLALEAIHKVMMSFREHHSETTHHHLLV